LYLILSPPYYNKSKCILEIDLSGLGLIENSNENNVSQNLQDFVIKFDSNEEIIQGESEPIRIDLREEVLKKKENFMYYHQNLKNDLLDNSMNNEMTSFDENISHYSPMLRANISYEKKSVRNQDTMRSIEKQLLSGMSSFQESIEEGQFRKKKGKKNKKKIHLLIPQKSEANHKGSNFRTLNAKNSRSKDNLEAYSKTAKISLHRESQDMYRFKFSNRTKDIHSKADLNKIFDHFFVKVMEVYTSGLINPMYQNKYYFKQAEEYKSDPERMKREMEKSGVSKLTRKIYEKVCNLSDNIFEEKKFISGLFLSKSRCNKSVGR
jgi:hypothetical protein